MRAAEAARTLGFRVSTAPMGNPRTDVVYNVWRRINDAEEALVGWIYADGSTIWEGAMFEAPR